MCVSLVATYIFLSSIVQYRIFGLNYSYKCLILYQYNVAMYNLLWGEGEKIRAPPLQSAIKYPISVVPCYGEDEIFRGRRPVDNDAQRHHCSRYIGGAPSLRVADWSSDNGRRGTSSPSWVVTAFNFLGGFSVAAATTGHIRSSFPSSNFQHCTTIDQYIAYVSITFIYSIYIYYRFRIFQHGPMHGWSCSSSARYQTCLYLSLQSISC